MTSSTTANPDLEAAISGLPAVNYEFPLDLAKLVFFYSAGILAPVGTEKLMGQLSGPMPLLHPNEYASEVFDMTSLIDVFAIEA